MGFWDRFSGVNITIRVICAAWFLAMVLIGGAGRMLLNAGGTAWEWLVPPAAVRALAGPDPLAVPSPESGDEQMHQASAQNSGMHGDSVSESEQRARKEGWGAGQTLPAPGTGRDAEGAGHF